MVAIWDSMACQDRDFLIIFFFFFEKKVGEEGPCHWLFSNCLLIFFQDGHHVLNAVHGIGNYSK